MSGTSPAYLHIGVDIRAGHKTDQPPFGPDDVIRVAINLADVYAKGQDRMRIELRDLLTTVENEVMQELDRRWPPAPVPPITYDDHLRAARKAAAEYDPSEGPR